ncbi:MULTISPECIES: 2TM domain-containing protein [Flavobacterium]|uniref:2TM domain-containing protein n=2 Tax=Flavobacterium covae TaxID=2906076 RepID=A0ABW8PHL5_9FLAO|nr:MULTISPECIES: 2TM domain-containing protein [Flavobacterium]MCJ1805519.1 2TM domain-containing protein [Flavobacterium covae]OXA73783.1 histidine kinase [Flavobacterium columnare] [Flavobacterium columnare NBRC 100251 = ATCC 23463]
MENFNDDFQRYEKARKKVKEIKDFYSHLISYLCINTFFIFINLKYSSNHIWFFYPMLGWGIGLFFHGLKVYDFSFISKNWEERKIQEFIEEEKKRNNNK